MLEYLGYLASVIVLISLLMSSIIKLRWINLIGSITFAVYGFLIGSIPVGFLNIGTSLINLYYLYKIYTSKEYFTLLEFDSPTPYFEYFVSFHQNDIRFFFPKNDYKIDKDGISFYILRNAVLAGVFVSSRFDDDTLEIHLDYVTKEYRDFKMGSYIFNKQKQLFVDKGYKYLVTYTANSSHEKYLQKMGFVSAPDLSSETEICYRLKLS
ncbi:MAG: hypothetical protein AB7U79_08900 [Candidatus Izemoplasmatales bacterium]